MGAGDGGDEMNGPRKIVPPPTTPPASRPVPIEATTVAKTSSLDAGPQKLAYQWAEHEGIRPVVRAGCVAALAFGLALTIRSTLDLLVLRELGPAKLRMGPGVRGMVGTLIGTAMLVAPPVLAWTGWRCLKLFREKRRVWLVRSLAFILLTELAGQGTVYIWFPGRFLRSWPQFIDEARGLLMLIVSLALPAFLFWLMTRPTVRREFEST
jgi:hypothetical protein